MSMTIEKGGKCVNCEAFAVRTVVVEYIGKVRRMLKCLACGHHEDQEQRVTVPAHRQRRQCA